MAMPGTISEDRCRICRLVISAVAQDPANTPFDRLRYASGITSPASAEIRMRRHLADAHASIAEPCPEAAVKLAGFFRP